MSDCELAPLPRADYFSTQRTRNGSRITSPGRCCRWSRTRVRAGTRIRPCQLDTERGQVQCYKSRKRDYHRARHPYALLILIFSLNITDAHSHLPILLLTYWYPPLTGAPMCRTRLVPITGDLTHVFRCSANFCRRISRSIDYVHLNPSNAPRTLVFVHGWPGLWSTWSNQISAFSSTYGVIALDLPGFGNSTHPGDFRASGQVRDFCLMTTMLTP